MIGVVGRLKITYTVQARQFEETFDLSACQELSLGNAKDVAFKVEEVNYIEDTVYSAVLSLLKPRYLEDEYLVDSGVTEFEIPESHIRGKMELIFLR